MKIKLYILTVIPFIILGCSPTPYETQDDIYDVLDSLSAKGEYIETISIATPLYCKAITEEDTGTRIQMGSRIGRAYYLLAEPDSMYRYFDDVLQSGELSQYTKEHISILNALGVFNMIHAINYSQALDYFYQAMTIATECGDWDSYYKSLTNVTIIHYYRKDPNGIETANSILQFGKEHKESGLEYIGTLMLAYMHHALNEDELALKYAEQTLNHPEFNTGNGSSGPIYASILASLGRNSEAERIFLECIDGKDTENSLKLESISGYCDFLISNRRFKEAIIYLTKGIEITEQTQLYFYGHNLYRVLADLYSRLGQYDLAVEYLNKYQHLADEFFNVEKERSFNSLLRKIEREINQRQLQQKDIQIMHQRMSIFLICGILLIVIILSISFYSNYRLRDRMYRQLVIKYNAALQKEMNANPATDEDIKSRELFQLLAQKMENDKLYEQKSITIEEVAKELGTNRGYLSKAVNTFAGVSFNAYVNSFRIKAAVKLLSDTTDETPIKTIADKLGYNNLTSFYNNFCKETGVPPSKYRLEMRKISSERQESDL